MARAALIAQMQLFGLSCFKLTPIVERMRSAASSGAGKTVDAGL
jgi:hypothetical protein